MLQETKRQEQNFSLHKSFFSALKFRVVFPHGNILSRVLRVETYDLLASMHRRHLSTTNILAPNDLKKSWQGQAHAAICRSHFYSFRRTTRHYF